jgi:hypothetical protein
VTTAAPASIPVSQRYDLRKTPYDDAVTRAEDALGTRLDLSRAVVKRRSVGAATGRGTWVRIELRGLERLDGQGWGTEAAAVLRGVPAPVWHSGASWLDASRGAMWHADETDLVTEAPVARAAQASSLPGSWWDDLRKALGALADHQTPRRATPDSEPVTQERIDSVIGRVFPGLDTAVTEWACAHADLGWANLTGPQLWLLDWEDWGMAPRGLDAARLWFASLTDPDLTGQVTACLSDDLASRSGKVMALFECAGWLAHADDSEPLTAAASSQADRLVDELSA